MDVCEFSIDLELGNKIKIVENACGIIHNHPVSVPDMMIEIGLVDTLNR